MTLEVLSPLDLAIGMGVAIVLALRFRRSAARDLREHEAWVSTHPHAIGVVDRIKEHSTFEHGTSYTPVIVYTLPNGQRYEIDGESSGFPTPPIGSEVEIAYDAALPSSARLVAPPPWTGDLGVGDVISFLVVAVIAAGVSTFIRIFYSAVAAAIARHTGAG